MYNIRFNLEQFVRPYLPVGAEIVTIAQPRPHPAVITVDLDNDRTSEIIAIYRLQGEQYLLVLQLSKDGWKVLSHVKGTGYGVTVLQAANVTGSGGEQVLVGWQLGSIWSKLSLYEWTREGLRDAAPEDAIFSYMDVFELPAEFDAHGRAYIALWQHDTGEAYRVSVVRWENGKLVPASEADRYYYPKVVHYYERLVRLHPTYRFYWYYLADAQLKAGQPAAALQSVRVALRIEQLYPSNDELVRLEEEITKHLERHKAIRRDVGLFPAPVKTANGTRWGYIDRSGSMVILPQFEEADVFQPNGLAIVRLDNAAGLIDASGVFVVKPIYDYIGPFMEGRAVIIDSEGFKLMDPTGQIVTKRAYSYIANLHEGRAMFYITDKEGNSLYGYLDGNGREVIPPQFMEAGDFDRGKALVKRTDNQFALIGLDGAQLAAFSYANVGPPGDGLLAFQQQENGKYGYIDEQGNIVIKPAFVYAQPFRNGRAVVNTSEDYHSQYGLIDKQGTFVIDPVYNEIRQLGEGRLALGKAIDPSQPFIGSTFAIADLNGKLLSDFIYLDIGDFKNGLASASDRNQTYWIDHSGHAAPGYPRLNGSGTLTMIDGLIQANVDRRLSYLDQAGRVIWRQNTIIPLREPYRVREEKYNPNRDYLVYYPQVEGMADLAAQRAVNDKLKELSQVKPVPGNIQLDYSYNGDFDVAFFKKDLLVLELTGYRYPFGAAHGMPTKLYTHINLVTGHIFELKELFKPGSDYVKVLSDIIGLQIKEDPQYSYVFPGTYKGIRPDQPFFVSENALHLYFEPYEIAPYAAGFPTFKIPFAAIMNIIAVDGPFWNSFHY
ncbi:WG repeat-containing protein [Paenibacillus mendelii]|uniref:WG repeat-containing protein n=1 Tax=Paenibacillus mendelii TaxID=206163 RepID=A0ABV6J903_9BACL|nr:WG repeat-containing protein [Paenibacillus mendelii]MCQ6560048.1 WG repeat-containing protein [Paenibacillus mendelii]